MFYAEAFLIFNKLVIGLRLPRGLQPLELVVDSGPGRVLCRKALARSAPDNPDGAIHIDVIGRLFSRQHVLVFLVTEEITDFELLHEIGVAHLSLSLRLEDQHHQVQVAAKPTSVEEMRSLHESVRRHLRDDKKTGTLVEALEDTRIQQHKDPKVHLDIIHWDGGVLFLHGWLLNVELSKVLFFSDGLAHFASGESGITHSRPDVTEFLRGRGIRIAEHSHGFSVVLPARSSNPHLTVMVPGKSGFEIVFAGQVSAERKTESVFPLLLRARQDDNPAPVARIAGLLGCFFPRVREPPSYDVIARHLPTGPGDRKPLSIVVPFYKEWRFIFSIFKMVRRAPANWEWVFVCDDPGIFGELHRYTVSQPPATRARVTFIRMKRNCGFGEANNTGVREASSNVVLLMNSDVWMSNIAPLQLALDAIAGDRYGLLGFRLLFEDGTVQHDGMSFEAKADLDNLYLVQHPGKGLLPVADHREPTIVDSDVVTGALMMTRRELFLDVGGFSNAYVGGDFEDADLCLQLRKREVSVGLVRSNAIFHLERQSIRQDHENAVAFARTLINCVIFNNSWHEFMDLERPVQRRPVS